MQKRKLQNRKAQRDFRQRKAGTTQRLAKEIEDLKMHNAALSDANQALTTRVSELEEELNTWLTITPDLGDLGVDQWAPGAHYVGTGQSDAVEGLTTGVLVHSASRAETRDPELGKGFAIDKGKPCAPHAETYQD